MNDAITGSFIPFQTMRRPTRMIIAPEFSTVLYAGNILLFSEDNAKIEPKSRENEPITIRIKPKTKFDEDVRTNSTIP